MTKTFADSLKEEAISQENQSLKMQLIKDTIDRLSSTIRMETRSLAHNGIHSVEGYLENVDGNWDFSDNTSWEHILPIDIDTNFLIQEANKMNHNLGFTVFKVELTKVQKYKIEKTTTF